MIPEGDISLLYSGGSGGFLFLHCLLLGGKHWCAWPGNKTTDQIIKEQWADNDQPWKSRETWPLNDPVPGPAGRVYFHCLMNQTNIDQWLASPGTKILLYTDLSTQLRMARYKQAKWFVGRTEINYRSVLRNCWVDNNVRLHGSVQPAWSLAEQRISLQDFVHADHEPAQQQLIDHWLSLHPSSLLHKAGL